MPKAVRITEDNVEDLIAWGKTQCMDLDYLRYETEPRSPELGPNYLITDGSLENYNVTCTVKTEADFRTFWKFKNAPELTTHFHEIERI